MSTATELLSRALDAIEYAHKGHRIAEEIRAFLAAEPEAEPVAWIDEPVAYIDGPNNMLLWAKPFQYCGPKSIQVDLIPLYLHLPRPEPARKAMSDVEIADIYYSGMCFEKGYLSAFAEGFRQAEKHHGIGGDDDTRTADE